MTRQARSIRRPTTMLLVDCPLCDRPAPLDAVTGALSCDACGVHVELAPEPVQLDLPLAA
jgi:uncharacterized Zn finger protein (UPF0148 family)